MGPAFASCRHKNTPACTVRTVTLTVSSQNHGAYIFKLYMLEKCMTPGQNMGPTVQMQVPRILCYSVESDILILIKNPKMIIQRGYMNHKTDRACSTCRSIVCKKYNRIALWRPQGRFIDFLSTSFHVRDTIPKEIIESDSSNT